MHTGTLKNEIAKKNNRVPTQFTGCVSELSCHTEDYPGYGEALKNYVDVYRKSHTYLDAGDAFAEHDYTLIVAETEEHGLLGLLGDDIEQLVRTHVHFSDEEIEKLGYLGWLQH